MRSEQLVSFLREAWAGWEAAGLPGDPGQDRVVPYSFAHVGLLGELPLREPLATWARTGAYCYDTMTLVGPGTWEAARAAVDAALTAAELVLAGDAAAFALVRLPGHHATRATYGGSCYLNSSAVAAQHLRARGVPRVAVLDVDAHHGNGAQSIFWERSDVFTASLHADPGTGWFPHCLALRRRARRGRGRGREPQSSTPADDAWLEGVGALAEAASAHGSEALVVPLGVDAAASDPSAPLEVTTAGFREAGRVLGALRRPTVLVLEGGYDLAVVGADVSAFLEGFEGA